MKFKLNIKSINCIKVKKDYLLYFLFLYPAFSSLITNKINAINWYLPDFYENILFALILISISFFINNSFFKKTYQISTYIILSIIAFSETSYYFLYELIF
ncbi:MAG: hypothetical protein B6I20_06530 [Bacteroidetes bacterium 4572_117]|nr:MAG: hypothetical protein B6I20_06530 [Bacteroidetes bacterium 4572_117]